MKTYSDLKFKDTISKEAVSFIVDRLGYAFHSRNFGHWIIYRKFHVLEEPIIKILTDQCNRVCEPFYGQTGVDKDLVSEAIKNLALTKKDRLQRNFILDWGKRNIDDVNNDDTPW